MLFAFLEFFVLASMLSKHLFCCSKSLVTGRFSTSTRLFSAPSLLTSEERTSSLNELRFRGWNIVDNRDAIHKEFVFRDFVEVADSQVRSIVNT